MGTLDHKTHYNMKWVLYKLDLLDTFVNDRPLGVMFRSDVCIQVKDM